MPQAVQMALLKKEQNKNKKSNDLSGEQAALR
jgi:hypothetical protein